MPPQVSELARNTSHNPGLRVMIQPKSGIPRMAKCKYAIAGLNSSVTKIQFQIVYAIIQHTVPQNAYCAVGALLFAS